MLRPHADELTPAGVSLARRALTGPLLQRLVPDRLVLAIGFLVTWTRWHFAPRTREAAVENIARIVARSPDNAEVQGLARRHMMESTLRTIIALALRQRIEGAGGRLRHAPAGRSAPGRQSASRQAC